MSSEVIKTNEDLQIPDPNDESALDVQARRKGVKPVEDVRSMARPDLFDEDDDFESFRTWLYEQRHGGAE